MSGQATIITIMYDEFENYVLKSLPHLPGTNG